MTKIDIFSGFLGAGKTTLIKKLLEEVYAGEQVVLIENEFGEIGIDGGFLKESGIQIREMNSGCICCSLVGDFGTSLKEVINTYHPDRILIEPSGVGKLSDVIKAVEEADVVLNSSVTLVDVTKCKMYMRNFGEFFNNQIRHAGTIVLSRTDKAGTEKVKAAVEMLRGLNKKAPIITTPFRKLTGEKILETMEHGSQEFACDGHGHSHDHECSCGSHGHDHSCTCDAQDHGHHHECGCGHHGHSDPHHHAEEVFASWGQETVNSYSREEVDAILKALQNGDSYGTVLRAKGIVQGAGDEWFYFDMVPGEQEVRNGTPEYTGRICVIGQDLNEERLQTLFRI